MVQCGFSRTEPWVCLYLVFGHGPHYEGAHHAWQGAHSIRDAHQNTGIAGGNVQVIHIEPWDQRKKRTHEMQRLCYFNSIAFGASCCQLEMSYSVNTILFGIFCHILSSILLELLCTACCLAYAKCSSMSDSAFVSIWPWILDMEI